MDNLLTLEPIPIESTIEPLIEVEAVDRVVSEERIVGSIRDAENSWFPVLELLWDADQLVDGQPLFQSWTFRNPEQRPQSMSELIDRVVRRAERLYDVHTCKVTLRQRYQAYRFLRINGIDPHSDDVLGFPYRKINAVNRLLKSIRYTGYICDDDDAVGLSLIEDSGNQETDVLDVMRLPEEAWNSVLHSLKVDDQAREDKIVYEPALLRDIKAKTGIGDNQIRALRENSTALQILAALLPRVEKQVERLEDEVQGEPDEITRGEVKSCLDRINQKRTSILNALEPTVAQDGEEEVSS
jgi:hypothetical protein